MFWTVPIVQQANILGKHYDQKAKQTSGQDGSIGKHNSPPHTTTAKITTRLQNKYCQKIELYGSPTTKELKKTHSSRWAGGVETQRGVETQTGTEIQNGQFYTHVW